MDAGKLISSYILLHDTYLARFSLKQFRLKEVDKVQMKRLVLVAIIKMCAEAILLTVIAGFIIAVLGKIYKWDASIVYSNAFFIAGCLMIVAGGMSRMIAGQEWFAFQLLSSESFRHMSSGERANFIIEASSSVRFVLIGVLSGLLLILISVIVAEMF